MTVNPADAETCDSFVRARTTGSFDCAVVRFANDHFVQDDTLK